LYLHQFHVLCFFSGLQLPYPFCNGGSSIIGGSLLPLLYFSSKET
jgi:hypothetical protein